MAFGQRFASSSTIRHKKEGFQNNIPLMVTTEICFPGVIVKSCVHSQIDLGAGTGS